MDYKFINTEYIVSVSGGDNDIIRELVSMFREQAEEITNEMQQLLQSEKYFELGLLAHKAKSSVAIMGMADLAIMLKTFELQAKSEDEKHLYQQYISRYAGDTQNAIVELDDFVTSLK